jgi:hypothetical protein
MGKVQEEELDSCRAAGGGRAGSWERVQGETGQVSPCRLFFGEHKASEGRQVRRPYACRR